MLGITTSNFLITFLDSASLKRVININFSSTHGHCGRKYNEMKNDFQSMIYVNFWQKMLMSAVILAAHIPCSLNA